MLPTPFFKRLCLGILLLLALWGWGIPAAHALLTDDHYDGNIFALYGSNGGLIPPRTTLEKSIEQGIPVVMVFYLDDSSDCKQFAPAIASLQVRYGQGSNFLAYLVDGLDPEDPQSPAHFYRGQVPQTLIFDRDGTILYDEVGNRPITEIENPVRGLFGLDPIAYDATPQQFNEVQTGFDLRSAKVVPSEDSTSDLTPAVEDSVD